MSINDDILYKIDSEIGKDKKVVELQREIERLNQEIRCLNNCIIEFHSEFCNKQAEINRLNNIINDLLNRQNEALKYINNFLVMNDRYKHGNGNDELELVRRILNKHNKELKGEDKE